MLLLTKLLHVKDSHVLIDVVKHVSVLITAQPFLLPIKPDWRRAFQQGAEILVIIAVLCRNKLARESHVVLVVEI